MHRARLAGVVVSCLLGVSALAAAQDPATVYKPGNGVVSPRLLREVKPGYPAEAMQKRVTGKLTMEVVVRADGSVGDVKVTKPLDPLLDEEAVKTVKQWAFAPGTRDGVAVPVSVEVEMAFTLDRGPRLDSPAVSRPGGGVISPRLVKEVKPNYPAEARGSGLTGTVRLECVVLTDGSVGDVSISQGLNEIIDAEAVRALRQWTFEPGQKDGKAVPVQVEVEMSFSLK